MKKQANIMSTCPNYSPLRYPGGKSKLYNLIEDVVCHYADFVTTYVEPFAGGASVALGLLLNQKVNKIIINDINIGVYSFWRSVCQDTEDLLRLITDTDVNIDNFNKQKLIYRNESQYSPELGFATFFLNRTCYSGILNAGPIGGYHQTGKYLLDARYKKKSLIDKIEKIARFASNIEVYNLDILDFVKLVIADKKDVFTYFDPPYYVKGKELYTNFLNHDDHKKICDSISKLKTPWLLSYDNIGYISDIYRDFPQFEFNMSYTINSKKNRIGTELLIINDTEVIDTINQIICANLIY